MLSFLTAFSTSFSGVVVAWPVVAALFTLPALVWHHHRYDQIVWSRIAAIYLFIFYLLGLVTFTLLPLPDDFAVYCVERDRPVQLVPFGMLLDILSFDAGDVLQVVLNVVVFVPLGVFAKRLLRLSNRQALLLGLVLSLLIEVTQGTALWGAVPCRYRVADVDDLIANTLGAWLGILMARFIPAEGTALD